MISSEAYAGKCARVIHRLRESGSTQPLALAKSTSNLFRHRPQEHGRQLDLREFNQVIRIDERERYADVEGLTTYADLVQATLPYCLMPAVVPQLKSITVGGAIAGIGIESSSFTYGFVHETMQELEVLLPDGRIVVANRDNEHRDLFFGFPNSYGTLGYALRVRVGLVPVKPFVKLTHRRYPDPESYFQAIELECRQGAVDFVDGTMFDGRNLYMTMGQFVDEAEGLSDYTYLQMYYRSIAHRTTDYLTVHDYLWRWDTDWFWCSKHFLLQYSLVRRLWGKERLCSTVYWKLWKRFHASRLVQLAFRAIEGQREAIIQDVEIPIEQASRFARFFNEEIGITPVWMCPVASRDASASYVLYPMDPRRLYVNFGFWDTVRGANGEGYFNKLIETKVHELDGRKSLYSNSYYSKADFDRFYGGTGYSQLKARYDPKGRLKSLYDKCVLRR